jgi:hypothetical protein
MKYTEFLELRKPEAEDPVDIDDLNRNMDLLDELLASWFVEEGGDWEEVEE